MRISRCRAGIPVPTFDLSADGTILVIDRFDINAQGRRIGFEDVAALMGRQVHDRLSNRKYEGSYERMAEAIRIFSSRPADDLVRFYKQLALSVMVRNGDAHLKNFGVLYTAPGDVRLAPMFDVVTTTIYTTQRPGGAEAVDRTLALKLRAGRHGSREYPDTKELLAFGRELCGVRNPQTVLDRIAQAMSEALTAAAADTRFEKGLLQALRSEWESGQGHASRGG
jgi:serine/threonine-protein kinase HipA